MRCPTCGEQDCAGHPLGSAPLERRGEVIYPAGAVVVAFDTVEQLGAVVRAMLEALEHGHVSLKLRADHLAAQELLTRELARTCGLERVGLPHLLPGAGGS